jgi:hypothetical protein
VARSPVGRLADDENPSCACRRPRLMRSCFHAKAEATL